MVKVFKEQATRYIESCRGDVRANELTEILLDAVEAVKFRKVPEQAVSAQVVEVVEGASEPTAFVMERLFACVASVTPQGLKIIDPWTDDDIWGVADGGWNSSCHSVKWRSNAQEKLLKHGFGMQIIQSQPRNYKGLGSDTKMIGKSRYPTAIEFTDGEVL